MTKDKNIDLLRLEKPQGRAQRSAVRLKRLSNLISDNIRESSAEDLLRAMKASASI